jgi:hypothetical protein
MGVLPRRSYDQVVRAEANCGPDRATDGIPCEGVAGVTEVPRRSVLLGDAERTTVCRWVADGDRDEAAGPDPAGEAIRRP